MILRFAYYDGDGKSDISVYGSGTWIVNSSGSPGLTTAPNAAKKITVINFPNDVV